MKSENRTYEMTARAAAAQLTGERILDATGEVFWRSSVDGITLEEVAREAGVTVQTVIRRFGNKESLFAAAVEREITRVTDQRDTAPVGDAAGTVEVLFDHYELLGDRVVKMLADEERSPVLKAIAEQGRVVHRDWCRKVFAPSLAGLKGVERKRRIALFVAICDVYTWKLLRRDAGLNRKQAQVAILELLEPLTKGT
jgi:AcrR family transcriptional regulator